jgi:hypothetical protein
VRWVHDLRPRLQPWTPKWDDFLLHRAFSAIEDEPLHYLKLIARRLVYLLPCAIALLWWRRWSRERLLLVAVAFSVILPYVFLRMENRYWSIAAFAYFLLAAIVVHCALNVRASKTSAHGQPPVTEGNGTTTY